MSGPMLEKLSEIAEGQVRIVANQDNDRKILEKHSEQLQEFSEILLRNTITVEDHKRRSLSLEKRQDKVEVRQDKVEDYLVKEKAKRQGIKEFFTLASYVFSGASAVGAALWGAYQFLKNLGV